MGWVVSVSRPSCAACVCTCPASPARPVREGARRARGAETGERQRRTGRRESLQAALTDPIISIRTRSDEMGTRSVCTDAQRAVTLCVPRDTSFVQRIRSSRLLRGHGSP